MASDLITLDYLLANQDEDETEIDADDMAQLQQGITVASAIIRNYCDRLFELTTDASQAPRTYRFNYDEGSLEIDDCTNITSVAIAPNPLGYGGRTLNSTEWFAMDVSDPVMSWLEFYPLWGFEVPVPGRSNYPTLITVSATWGWPEIPDEVQFATAITVQYLLDDTTNSGTANAVSQSIASYSTSTSSRGKTVLPEAPIPYKAQAILDKYAKWNV